MTPIFQALACHAQDRPDAIAFRDGERSMTWADLARAVSRAAAGFAAGPRCVGLALGGLDYVIGDLAATLAGCRVVPVPGFFSAGQVAHLLADSGATLTDRLPAGATGLPLAYAGGATRVIYTSGTTGRPKGVILGDRQLTASALGLSQAIGAGPGDRYLSVLPQAQLLEQICGIFLPILAALVSVYAASMTPPPGWTRAPSPRRPPATAPISPRRGAASPPSPASRRALRPSLTSAKAARR